MSFGPAEPVSSSNVDQAALASCNVDTSRALVVTGQIHTVGNSSLSDKVDETFAESGFNDNIQFVMAYSNLGTQCYSPGNSPDVMFTVDQGQYDDFNFWVILDGVITPDNTNPDPAALGQWDLQVPGITLEGNQADVTASGPSVITCQDGVGDQYTYLVPAGSLPRQVGGDLYGQSCTPAGS
jgi:hypothetical protein